MLRKLLFYTAAKRPTRLGLKHLKVTTCDRLFSIVCEYFVGQARSPKRSKGVSKANAPDSLQKSPINHLRQARGFATAAGAAERA